MTLQHHVRGVTQGWPSDNDHVHLRNLINEATSPKQLLAIYARTDFQRMMKLVVEAQGGYALAWSKRWAPGRTNGESWADPYEAARKTILNVFLERLHDIVENGHVTQEELFKEFTVQRIADILLIFLPVRM